MKALAQMKAYGGNSNLDLTLGQTSHALAQRKEVRNHKESLGNLKSRFGQLFKIKYK